ncbi:DUF2905 domain-containing protein [Mycetohabitans sp. B5]|uniref:DUF2905 family protein n=1 Tax=Mycetohabitans endofungorum TaxID=417203 RepID=A0A2P5K8F9_9BURK|nr:MULTISPECIES: DUF2905 family protein [Mycetohabitans]MCG1053574.1 DUF2905 domain-containing protein [Mycetohabitans sp. B5]PPB83003.1 Protein of unknown function (DUF2905) [Mycetohabitans endofungorum]
MFRWLLTTFMATAILSATWPWLARLGIGRLPGDLALSWRGRRLPLPFMSTLLLTLLGSLIVRLL